MSLVQFVNKENLRIARENTGLASIDASKRISTSKLNLVGAFESGEKKPTWAQVNRLAKLYDISPILLLSDGRITKNKEIPDYRVGADPKSVIAVNKLVNFVISRQRWLENKLKSDGVKENPLQGKGKNISAPKALAELIKNDLQIDLEFIKSIRGEGGRERTLKYLIKKAEERGVFVGKTVSYHRLDVNDLRGLFISNKYCPFIVINRRDAYAGQIFSFIHELAHLFRKTDSLSNSIDFRTTGNLASGEEVFCNRVAVEFLLPAEELKQDFYQESDIQSLSIIYKASALTVFYRLRELGKLRSGNLKVLERKLISESNEAIKRKEAQQKEKKGGNFINSMKDSNGSLFNMYVQRLYSDNDIGHVEAKNILRFSPELA